MKAQTECKHKLDRQSSNEKEPVKIVFRFRWVCFCQTGNVRTQGYVCELKLLRTLTQFVLTVVRAIRWDRFQQIVWHC